MEYLTPVVCLVAVLLVCVVPVVLYCILQQPYHYPYFEKGFDVSGKKEPEIEEYIERYINQGGFEAIKRHQITIQDWKKECQQDCERSLFKNLRTKQYQEAVNDDNAYLFTLYRQQTRYRQQNYQKIPYKVQQSVNEISVSFEFLQEKYEKLKEIGFEATLSEYETKNQRKLMTKELRKQIMERDNYTCQNCGKYMPDTVGLQIDHIVPVAKGGKSIPSNLQVLCSICNGSKSDKI